MSQAKHRKLLVFVVIVIASIFSFFIPQSSLQKAKVIRVIDGDTVELSNHKHVRYIGMNTPEMNFKSGAPECYAKEATNFNKKLVLGKTVYLGKDISYEDKYHRLLRYVYVKNNSGSKLLVNEELVKQGYATMYIYPPDVRLTLKFLFAHINAIRQGKGLWGACQ